jgi:hypothetical protein
MKAGKLHRLLPVHHAGVLSKNPEELRSRRCKTIGIGLFPFIQLLLSGIG